MNNTEAKQNNIENHSLIKKNNSRKINKELAVLIAIPVCVFLFMVALLLVPQYLAHPKYSFIYAKCNIYQCSTSDVRIDSFGNILNNSYEKYNSRAEMHKYDRYSEAEFNKKQAPQFYIYDIDTGESKQVYGDEINRVKVSSSLVSPDGYSISKANDTYTTGLFLFGGGSSYKNSEYYVKNGILKKNIDLGSDQPDDRSEYKILGWVKNEQ